MPTSFHAVRDAVREGRALPLAEADRLRGGFESVGRFRGGQKAGKWRGLVRYKTFVVHRCGHRHKYRLGPGSALECGQQACERVVAHAREQRRAV